MINQEYVIYINSEKHVSSRVVNSKLSFDDLIEMAGYPSTGTYTIKDELNSTVYHDGDCITIYNNVSLVITPN